VTSALKLHASLWWRYLLAFLFVVIFGYPLFFMITNSFRPTQEILQNIWGLPTGLRLDNYVKVLSNTNFLSFYGNSMLISALVVPVLVLSTTMISFVFARLPFRGSQALFYTFLAGTMIPVHVTLIPLYTLLRDLGWLNNLVALLFPYIAFNLPVSIYIMKDFFGQIPREIEEAAYLDGCSTAKLFWAIMLPLSRPAVATISILALVNVWNEYLFASTFLAGNSEAYTLPLGVVSLVKGFATLQYDQMFAGITLATVPLLLFYLFAQEQIIASITAGSIK